MASNNPWIGAQIAMRFPGSDEPADLLVGSGSIMYEVELGLQKFRLPVVGNVGSLRSDPEASEDADEQLRTKSQELLQSSRGIHIGLAPYYVFADKAHFAFTAHGALGWKLNSYTQQSDSTQRVYLHQFRISGGVEVQIGARKDGRHPITLSLAPVVAVFFDTDRYALVFGSPESKILAFEATLVAPLAKGFGVIVEGIIAGAQRGGVRAGLVLSGEAK